MSYSGRPQSRGFNSRPSYGGRPGYGGGRPQRGGFAGPRPQYIHPSKYVNRAKDRPVAEEVMITHQFADFGLQTQLAANVVSHGYTVPTPIQDQAIPFAMEGERMACGSAHADNVAPALLGGIVLIRSNHPLDVIALPVPARLFVVVVHPHVVLMTRQSRQAVKKQIPLHTVVAQTGHTAAFIAGLFTSDYRLIGRSAVDFLAEPNRARLIPAFDEVKKRAMQEGVLACSISGSGPSVFALCDSEELAGRAGTQMAAAFLKDGIVSDIYLSKVNRQGVKITG